MPVNYTVQAQVIDIQTDTPKPTDSFLVDTNVWFWIAYPKASPSQSQNQSYPPFVSRSIRARAKLHRCELSLSELAHLIEKTEREIYQRATANAIGTKEYRHNLPAERANVVAEVQAAWGQVKTMAAPLAATVDEPLADAALIRFQTQPLDGYDLFMLLAAAQGQIVQVLTDDGDYCTIPGIQMFTANRNVLNTARAQGKLLVR
jgi:hypothetical protein